MSQSLGRRSRSRQPAEPGVADRAAQPEPADSGDGFAHFDLATMAKPDSYKLLASVILPRPIAWVVSRDAAGILNAAPFSFFNILSSDPPLVAISFSVASDRKDKDSLANIRARREFVVNMVLGRTGAGHEHHGHQRASRLRRDAACGARTGRLHAGRRSPHCPLALWRWSAACSKH